MMRTQIWIGAVFLFLGVGILLDQLEVWNFGQIVSMWWPLIFIIIGIIHLINYKTSSPVLGILFLIIGGVILASKWTDVNLTAFIWPLIFIFIGLFVIFSRFKQHKVPDSEHYLKAFSLFSGTEFRSQSPNLQGGDITAIFGGAEIDLRDSIISEDGATLNLTTAFGGIVLIVPENVRIEVSGLPILGGWEDKTRRTTASDQARVIKLNCLTILGGVEIKN